ncbi:MAG TPA: hypothetical protein PKA64_03570 [Myxococcota bacterium]|nr:hypothetical protein [Myxococcota bacterium]
MLGWTLLLVSDLALAAPAATPPPQPPPAQPPAPPDDHLRLRKRPRSQQHGLALTLSSGLASRLLVEGSGEINLPGQHALAVILGAGSELTWEAPFWSQLVLDGGLQYRYTVKGDFDTGVWVGLEALALVRPLQVGVPVDAPISPLVGFKHTTPFGLVVDLSAGPTLIVTSYGSVRASATLNVQIGGALGKASR